MAAVEAEAFTIKAGMKNSKVRVTVIHIQNKKSLPVLRRPFQPTLVVSVKAYVMHVAEHCLYI